MSHTSLRLLACTTAALAVLPLAPAQAAPHHQAARGSATVATHASSGAKTPAKQATGWRTSGRVADKAWRQARVQATLRSAGVAYDENYGPIEKISVSVRNTGHATTKYLDLQLPDGKVYLDAEGEKMFIGNCTWAFPLKPGEESTCTAYRRLEKSEIAAGRTTPQKLVVAAFGAKGPKVSGLSTTSTRFTEHQVNGEAATVHVASAGVRKDANYGPVEVLKLDVVNTGHATTKYLDLQLPDGKVYLDAEGEQMFIGNCTWAFPLKPGEKSTCDAYRRLTDEELASGRTTPQKLQAQLFGKGGTLVKGLSTGSSAFDPATVR